MHLWLRKKATGGNTLWTRDVISVRQHTEAKLKLEKRSTVTNKDVFSMATYWCQKRIIVPTCI